jgi:hypothetical protein
MSGGNFGVPGNQTNLDARYGPATDTLPGTSTGREGGMTGAAALKFLRSQGLSSDESKIVAASLPDSPTQTEVSQALDKWRRVKPLSQSGYSKAATTAIGVKLLQKPVGTSVNEVIDEVKVDKPNLTKELDDVRKAVTAASGAPGGAQNPPGGAGDGFHGNGGDLSSLADDSFLNALRSQARNFLSATDLQYLASVGTPDEFLAAMVKSEGSQEAQRALYAQTHSADAAQAGLAPEGDQFATTAKVAFDPSERTTMSPPSGQRITSRVDPGSAAAATLAQSTGKSVTEAVRYIRDMSPEDLTNLQRKLVEAGYYAQVMSGSGFEPDVWGDPTDPATNAAWKALLRDTIAQKTDVATLLTQRTAANQPAIAKLRSEKAKDDERKALAEALQNQVTVSDTASLRTAASKIASAGDMTGKDLAPNELDALATWIQGLQASTQRAAKHGASVAVDVNPVDQMTERIAATHPVDVMGQRIAGQADELARLLRGPGA